MSSPTSQLWIFASILLLLSARVSTNALNDGVVRSPNVPETSNTNNSRISIPMEAIMSSTSTTTPSVAPTLAATAKMAATVAVSEGTHEENDKDKMTPTTTTIPTTTSPTTAAASSTTTAPITITTKFPITTTLPTTTTFPTTTVRTTADEHLILARANDASTSKPIMATTTTIAETWPSSTMTTTTTTMVLTTSESDVLDNGVSVKFNSDESLHPSTAVERIKLAEIITDEFVGAPPEQLHVVLADKEIDASAAATAVSGNAAQDDDERRYRELQQKAQAKAASMRRDKLNIVDLFPMKAEDFYKPSERDDTKQQHQQNEVQLKDDDTNLLQQQKSAMVTKRPTVKPLPRPITQLKENGKPPGGNSAAESDFTGKVLADRDGAITEIETKFQLKEYQAGKEPAREGSKTVPDIQRKTIDGGNWRFNTAGASATASNQQRFIDRRVKKSFDFPMHRSASDVMAMPHIDFASTKFTGNAKHLPHSSNADISTSASQHSSVLTDNKNADNINMAIHGAHPEFSTTKFYNSKELYNEMMQYSRQQRLSKLTKPPSIVPPLTTARVETTSTTTTALSSGGGDGGRNAANRFAVLKAEEGTTRKTLHFTQAASQNLPTTTMSAAATSTPNTGSDRTTTTTITTTTPLLAHPDKPLKQSNGLRRAKLLLKTLLSAKSPTRQQSSDIAVDTSTYLPTQAIINRGTSATTNVILTNSPTSPLIIVNPTTTEAATTDASTTQPQYRVANTSPKPSTLLKPLIRSRPHITSPLQEKINALDCEIQIPQQNSSHLWRGNETHELQLPIVSLSPRCRNKKVDCQLPPIKTFTWFGEAEIQSGDILIVEINDAKLISLNAEAKRATNTGNKNNITSAHTTQVYQVTRPGYERCDVTEGTLLDITPLVVDGRKLVTLYDKDFTEGVNLLIVVSELWGTVCVRLKVTTKTDNCGESADCSGKGVCFSNAGMEDYECQCCSGFTGQHCEEIDACIPSPCTNNGICVDLSQGHDGNAYQCLCPYGYTGKNCQYEADPCNPAECLNGGSCIGNFTHFRCDCAPGFAGPLCQHSLNECESSPCVHGICVDQEDGFRCFCQPGFAGELCNFEYNECESSPCQNNGECIDHIGSYECRCTKGYTGTRCHIKVDVCAHKPCPEGRRCIDRGNDFSCECTGGRNGPDCNQLGRTQCNVNPCSHGGTCWSSGESFYCACRPGYTGTMCEDEFIVETVVSASEFLLDESNARNFIVETETGSSGGLIKSPIELHNAYFGFGVLATAIFIVAIVVTICHCKVHQTYRKFSTSTRNGFIPILGFSSRRNSSHNNSNKSKLNKHWLSGKSLLGGSGRTTTGANGSRSSTTAVGAANALRTTRSRTSTAASSATPSHTAATSVGGGPLYEPPFQRHLAMNLENDMYYTVDFSEHSQHSPLIQ